MSDSNRKSQRWAIDTRLVHSGRNPHEQYGFVNTPIYRGSTVLYPNTQALKAHNAPYVYGRKGTPTMSAFEHLIADMDGAAGAVAVPSGLAAVTTALLACVKSGDHILMTDSVYRPARHFCDTLLKNMGVETQYYDPLIGGGIAALMRENTKVVYTEAPGSQTMEMQDIPAIAEAAHARGALVLTDNTWGTSLFFDALGKGVDVCIHAATKYIVGHSDALLGAVSANERAWPQVRAAHDALGNCAGPEDIFLGLRGARTMRVRMEHQQQIGLEMARWFAARPEVAKVLHPALPGAPGHDVWARDFSGAPSLFSIVLHPVSEGSLAAMLDGLELFGMGFSWGGFESLVVPFDPRDYRTASTWDEPGPALRFHFGLEDVEDLQADLARGFARLDVAS